MGRAHLQFIGAGSIQNCNMRKIADEIITKTLFLKLYLIAMIQFFGRI